MTPASLGPAPPTNARDLEERLLQFDRTWQSDHPPQIDDFLSGDAAARREALEELIKIDLEYRWRLSSSQPAGPSALRLEDYISLHAELGPIDRLPLVLIAEEYRARRSWGDRPAHAEYAGRFPQHGDRLSATLLQIDAELTAEESRARRASLRKELSQPEPPESEATAVILPTIATSAALVQTLRDCGILSQDQAEELAGDSEGEPKALAEKLRQRGWITAYQIEQIFQGRWPHLLVGPYVLLERLGEGGAGQVFKARHRQLQTLVALKLIRKEHLTDRAVLGRFQREIRVVSRLEHDHVVRAYDSGTAGAAYYLAMEFIEGINLDRLVKESGPLPVAQACDIVRQAALGLQYIHENGLVHRDIKPSNLLVSGPPYQVKILDLGLARLRGASDDENTTSNLTPTGAMMLGTPNFLAPEQAIDFHGADIRADIYSLGCAFYFLLTGQPPFPGGTLAEKLLRHQQADPPSLQSIRPDVPTRLVAILDRMLAKRAEDRYPVPGEVASALAALLQSGQAPAGSPILVTSPTFKTADRRPVRTRGRLVLIGSCVLLGLIAPVIYRSWRAAGDGRPTTPAPASAPASRLPQVQTMTFYATAGDGRVGHFGYPNQALGKAQWDLVHDAPAGNDVDTAGPRRNYWVGSGVLQSNAISITRGFLVFDTSKLPADAVIIEATLGVFVMRKRNDLSDGKDFFVVVQGLQASSDTLGKEDFSRVGHRPGSHRVALADVEENAYLKWALNAEAISWISKTGPTQLAVREGHDLLNQWPGYRPKHVNYIEAVLSEHPGTAQDPYLLITFRTPEPK